MEKYSSLTPVQCVSWIATTIILNFGCRPRFGVSTEINRNHFYKSVKFKRKHFCAITITSHKEFRQHSHKFIMKLYYKYIFVLMASLGLLYKHNRMSSLNFLSYKFWAFQIFQLCTVKGHNFQLNEYEVIVVENKTILQN